MIYTEMIRKALKICFKAHEGQTDRSGVPYVFHPYHLAEQMDTEEEIIVALLHDVIEDTEMTIEDLHRVGFSEPVLEAITLLTKTDLSITEYNEKIRQNPLARKVKIADLKHNMDLSRLKKVTEKDKLRCIVYKMSLEYLEN